MSNPSITADKTPWYQWDTGLTATVSGGEMTECHFANRKQGTAYVQAVINGIARVPDELLQVASTIKAYGYVSDGAGGQTYVEQTFDVIARNIPSDYTYTKTAQKTIRDAEAARDEAVKAAKDAKASELAAEDSVVEASNSAQSAGESASAAATSASNAAKSAGEAAKSASDAKAAAGKAVDDASALLKTYTDNAKTSADNAATSASNAADSASAASRSASDAAQSATDASNAKAAAQTAKAEAEAAKSEAATSASNAAESAENAANSARAAANSVNSINVIAPKKVTNGASVINPDGLAIGAGASVEKDGVAVGCGATSEQWESVAVGFNSSATGYGAIAIGKNAYVAENNSVAIGNESTALSTREFSVGNASFTRKITNVREPVSSTDASTKKYTDDNDAKTLSEAKKYTDDNTSNALVGTVSGKLLHVEDAWPSKPLSLTIEGAYKQDGTPSLDNPVPIQVIENPTLKVTGRNLLDYTRFAGYYYADIGTRLDDDIQVKPLTESLQGFYSTRDMNSWSEPHLFTTDPLNAGIYVLSFAIWSDTGAGAYTFYTATSDYVVTRRVDGAQAGNTGWTSAIKKTISQAISVSDGERICLYVDVNGKKGDVTKHFVIERPMVTAVGGMAYAPYVGTSLPITLPTEHPYLAKLPDGTCDTIEIGRYGNASLVARVGKTETADTDGINATVGTDALSSNGALDDGATVYYKLATPVTYSLGKLDIPSLPETISNVWTEAELTTNMSMTYKRDINIAFENLAQAVVAAAAGE